MWLVVGLGNPGEKYAKTRHNVGFMVIDSLAQGAHGSFQTSFNAEVARSTLENESVSLIKPQTFMNRSGDSVQVACHFHKIPPENVIVVHDEIDLPMGAVRVKFDGGHGGHNGIRDIIRVIGPAFVRIRVGIGRPAIKGNEADFVLSPYRADEKQTLAEQIVIASDAVKMVIREGVQKAQMGFNHKH